MRTDRTIRRRAVLLVAAVALALPVAVLATGTPAGAGQLCDGTAANAPDGRIKLGTGAFLGIGSYPATSSVASIPIGSSATWKLRWKNVSSNTRNIAVQRHSVVGGSDFTIRYFLGAQNVTQTFKDGKALFFPNTGPGESTTTLDVVITRKSDDAGGVIVRMRGFYAPTLPRPKCDALFPAVFD